MCGWPSRESSATYAVPAVLCDASMMLTAPGGSLGSGTLAQVLPASRVICTRPVLVPTQISPAATGEGARAWIDPPGAGAARPLPVGGSGLAGGAPSGPGRSGLMACQVSPRSFDARTYCAAMYKVCGSCGENASGGAPAKRSAGVG